MKKFKITVFLIASLIISLVILLNIGSNINMHVPYKNIKNPEIKTTKNLNIYYIETAFAKTLEAFTYAGGSPFKIRKISHMAVYIIHPKGNFLFDTGLGEGIDEQFKQMQAWLKPFFKYTKTYSAKEVFTQKAIEIDKIFLSHMHWDHASGIEDFPEADIFTTKEEYHFAQSHKAVPPAFISSQYDNSKIQWNFINFNSGPYEIFTKSLDLYGDGIIVFVQLQGHTHGSIGMFVNLSAKQRYFFTGDLTWTTEGFSKPAEKFYISSVLVDGNRTATKKQVYEVSLLLKNKPEIQVIPAHDTNAYHTLKNSDLLPQGN